MSLDQTDRAELISGWEPGEIRVGERHFRESIVLKPGTAPRPWAAPEPAALTLDDLAPALDLQPEILILGTGDRLVFPDGQIHARILALGIGFEVMDSGAACRTYNILVAEDRPVVAALIVE
ncbi:MAG: MTH938/NDUFAF3 family protein [Gammaproteobacteria bacterium]